MTAPHSSAIAIMSDTQLPHILLTLPHLRPILDKYGLKGCGGPLGPPETVEFFARAHAVPLAGLLTELRAAAAESPKLPGETYRPGPADTIFKLFFKGCIVVALTAGAVWGAMLLLRVGFSNQFTVNPIFTVNAHGHAMIFGWVGLMVMGFAYQAFPRFKHTELYRPAWAVASFWLMTVGITTRVLAEPFHAYSPLLVAAAMTACALELAAISIFVWIMLKTFARSRKPVEFFDWYIFASLAFFVLQSLGDAALLWLTTAAADEATLLYRVATYQAPLRDLQIHGFALLMILGVSQRYLPAIYQFKAPSMRLSKLLFVPLVLAILGEAVFFVLMRQPENRMVFGILLYGCMLAFGAIVTVLVLDWRVFARCSEPDRSVKFLKTAFAWLLASVAMLALLPVYMHWYRQTHATPFSHAYYGAVRHAITVGFISFMMLGVSSKIVPTLMGLEVQRLTKLHAAYALLLVGCTMRVVFQVLTDVPEIESIAFKLAGVSGVFEVAAIALWGAHLWRVMNGTAEGVTARAPVPSLNSIDENSKVGVVLHAFPETLQIFVAYGFELLANPYFRETLARNISIRDAARVKNVDAGALLADLRKAMAVRQPNASTAASSAMLRAAERGAG